MKAWRFPPICLDIAQSSAETALPSTQQISDQRGAWDLSHFLTKGVGTNLDVVNIQQTVILSSIDKTGLIFGPIGHGVAFVDSTTIEEEGKVRSSTRGSSHCDWSTWRSDAAAGGNSDFDSHPNVTTGSSMPWQRSSNERISLGECVLGDHRAAPSSGGAADFTVVLPDGSIRIKTEDLVAEQRLWKYPRTPQAPRAGHGRDFRLRIWPTALRRAQRGGEGATVTLLLANAYVTFPYPFPMKK